MQDQKYKSSVTPLLRLLYKGKEYWLFYALFFILQLKLTQYAVRLYEIAGEIMAGNIFDHALVVEYLVKSVLIACLGFTAIPMSFVSIKFRSKIQNYVWHQLLRLPVRDFDRLIPSSLVSRVTVDAAYVDSSLSYFTNLFQEIYALYLSTVVMFQQNSFFALRLLILVVFSIIVSLIAGKFVYKIHYAIQQVESKLTFFLNERMSSLRTIKAAQTEAFEIENGKQINREKFKAKMRNVVYDVFYQGYIQLTTIAVELFVLIYGAKLIQAGQMEQSALYTIFLLSVTYPGKVQIVFTSLLSLVQIKGQTQVVSELVDQPEEELKSQYPAATHLNSDDICFQNVSFRYTDLNDDELPICSMSDEEVAKYRTMLDMEGSDEADLFEQDLAYCLRQNTSSDNYVLKNLNFCLKGGKTTAIVGPSGSGKTTILKLLERFYQPTEGELILTEADRQLAVESCHKDDWRQNTGYIIQNSPLLPGTIRENILYGASAPVTDEEMTNVVKLCNLDEFLDKLPEGLDTQVGDLADKISGGQRQRIAIARALINNPKLLLMDEATASMDAQNENFILDGILKQRQGKTTVMVAHRLSTVKNVDQVLLLDEGELVGIGTHDSLYRDNTLYRQLVDMQAIR